MNKWRLPTSVTVDGTDYEIRTDYRAVIDVLIACNDADILADKDANLILTEIILKILVVDFNSIKGEHIEGLLKELFAFIDMGEERKEKQSARLMDWEQDAGIIIPAVNKVLSKDVRGVEYMHWWTFLSAYMEIGEGTFSTVLSIRNKRNKGKKLEKWEQEYMREHNDIVALKHKLTEEDKAQEDAEKEALKKLLH